MNKPLISVIVPVYNVELYLKKCVESIISQTYNNLEIILVNDGSTDNSGKICDEYEKLDTRIKVIHKENGGQATARNMALDIACGEYIGFVDSDDYIAPDMYETLYESIEESGCDIAVCGRYVVEGDRQTPCFDLDEPVVMNSKAAIKRLLIFDKIDSSVCDKLIKSSLLKDIRFPAGYICEDIDFVYRFLDKTDKIIHCGIPLYYYIQRRGSTSRSEFHEKTMGMQIYCKKVYDFALSKYPDLKREAEYFYFSNLLSLYVIMVKSKYEGARKKEVRRELAGRFLYILKNPYFSMTMKAVLTLIVSCTYGAALSLHNIIKRK